MSRVLRITHFAADGFRNLRSVEITPDPHANVFVGRNGQGKTSLLEAIDYVATLRSFRSATRTQLIGHAVERASISLRVEGGESPHEFLVSIERSGRSVRLDGKRPERAIAYYGSAGCVVFQPEDLDLVRGEPAMRRRLLDRVLVRTVDGYGEALRSYARALRARNAVLRAHTTDRAALAAYEPILAAFGSVIVRERQRAADEIAMSADEALRTFAQLDAALSLAYRTRATSDPASYSEILRSAVAMDVRRKSTTIGPHMDELEVRWNGRAARVVASQGQARALALALRLGELRALESRTGTLPWLLLDDISSELDRERTEKLLALIRKLGAQLWLTTTDPTLAQLLPSARVQEVENGTLRT